MNYGFIKAAAIIPQVLPANTEFNREEIVKAVKEAASRGANFALLPELSLTGYTCGDLFLNPLLINAALKQLLTAAQQTKALDIVIILGLPLLFEGKLINAAAVLYKGEVLGISPKTFLPNYKEFYEKRYFSSAADIQNKTIIIGGKEIPLGTDLLFKTKDAVFTVEICEDLWAPIPPSSFAAQAGAEIIFNLSASDELTGKYQYLKSLASQQSARCLAGYVYASCGFGESTSDAVFAGNAFIFENGTLLEKSERFSLKPQIIISEIDVQALRNERLANTTFKDCASNCKKEYRTVEINSGAKEIKLSRKINSSPFVPQGFAAEERFSEITEIQAAALAKRIMHTKARKLVIGVSGGLDSTLALLICKKTLDRLNLPASDILAVTMPGFGTTDRTYRNAVKLIKLLGADFKEIDIKQACLTHFKDIGHNKNLKDSVYENAQARERTQILMDLANKYGGLVIGTGDMSELALGWATFNGDHMSMYGVNCGVPKTLVKHLVKYLAQKSDNSAVKNILLDIIDTPISPELLPADKSGKIAQKTEDLVGPYELHDFFLYYFLRYNFEPKKILFLAQYAFQGKYSKNQILKWLKVFFKRFFTQQFKRSCLPDGPKIGSAAISPRADLRLPSDIGGDLWLKDIDEDK